MSFIFSPCPYEDETAINHLEGMEGLTKGCYFGFTASASALLHTLQQNDVDVIAIDGAPSALFDRLVKAIQSLAAKENFAFSALSTNDYLKDSRLLHQELEYYLPEDLSDDPAQIFGKLYDMPYSTLFDEARLEELKKALSSGKKTILYGSGAACEELWPYIQKTVFFDVSNKVMFLRIKNSQYTSLGDKEGLPIPQQFRRIYYIDFQLGVRLRDKLINRNKLDFYMVSDRDRDTMLLEHDSMRTILAEVVKRPFRCKPFYSEGVWGGNFIMHMRNLPLDQFKNIAWSIDLNGMDQSLVIKLDARHFFELPFLAMLQEFPEEIMGKELVSRFGHYFPIRFSYDDTFHSGGNMSIQCHPADEFCKKNFNEFGRQDEGYYIVEAAHDAKTYLGFKNGIRVEDFCDMARKSETEHIRFDHDEYVNSIKSIPGKQFMIPGGTIHSSGRNQLVLEIGSMVMGSYTFKQYDYLRMDLDGNPRPIHTKYGRQVLAKDRDADFVDANLCVPPRLLEKGETWEEYLVGEHPLVYYSCRQLKFATKAKGDTKGRFHVMTLVDGEKVTIRSVKDPSLAYTLNYLDVVLIPSDVGEYEIINNDYRQQPVVIYKVQVKE